MAWVVEFRPAAVRQFRKLPRQVQIRLKVRIDALASDPTPPSSLKLAGLSGLHRLRVGECRIVYLVQDERLVVLVVKIGHRREIYRK